MVYRQCTEPNANECGGDHDTQQWPTPFAAILPERDQISQAKDGQKKCHHNGHWQVQCDEWNGHDAEAKPETTL
jgi:hypothetical protein